MSRHDRGFGIIDEKGHFDQTMLQAAKVLGTMPGKDLDGDGKVGDFERGVGLLRLKQLQYSEGNVTLDKATADNLSNKTGFNFKAGERVRFDYDSETGAVSVAKGERGISKITKSGATTEANYNSEELKGLAEIEQKNGHSNGAKALNEMASALKEGETAKVNISGDGEGHISTIDAKHGSNVLRVDHVETGRTVKYEGWTGEGKFNSETVKMTGGVLSTYGHGNRAYSVYKGMIEDGGRQYSGTVEMDGRGNIINLNEAHMRTQTVGDSRKEIDENIKQYKRGESIDISKADMEATVITGDSSILATDYRDALEGTGVTKKGIQIVHGLADAVGGYGSMSQALRDQASTSSGLNVRFDSDKAIIGKILSYGIGVSGGGSAGGSFGKNAVEGITADTLRLGALKYYKNEIAPLKNADEKAAKLAEWGHGMFELMNQHGGKGTTDQLTSSAPNPLKDDTGEKSAEVYGNPVKWDPKR